MKRGKSVAALWFTSPFLLCFLCVLPYGCKVHQTLNLRNPKVCVPNEYQYLAEEGTAKIGEWWQQFDNSDLNAVVDCALSRNLNLKQSWWKLAQACAQTRIQGAARWPEIAATPAFYHFRTSDSKFFESELGETSFLGLDDSFSFYLLTTSLSYEIDLWRRVDSKVKSACFEMQATREDLESTALTLTGTVVDLWFTIQEQKTLLEVIDNQIDASNTQLELIELRFGTGQSSALDVYQQRLQLAATIAERPPVQSLLDTAQNQMSTLLGGPPEKTDFFVESGLMELPPFPDIGSPIDLLGNRPDLRSQQRRLMAADYEVAAAIADRFPRLDFSLSYYFDAKKIKDIFDSQISQIVGSLLTPLLDGGRRRAEVQRRKAIICELLNGYGQNFLNALLEVEDALTREKHQLDLLEQLNGEIEISSANLEESRWHYINGLNDYLTVIAAIQSLQDLERRVISEKKQLLVIRSKLYRALGGPYLTYWSL